MDDFTAFESPVVWENLETQKRDAGARWARLRAVFMHGETQPGQEIDDLRTPIQQFFFVIGKQEHVIDIPEIAPAFQYTLDEMIERIEINVADSAGICG